MNNLLKLMFISVMLSGTAFAHGHTDEMKKGFDKVGNLQYQEGRKIGKGIEKTPKDMGKAAKDMGKDAKKFGHELTPTIEP